MSANHNDKRDQITPAIREAVHTVLLAKAHAQLQREAMDKLDRELLAENVWTLDPKWRERQPELPERITEPKELYLMTEDRWDEYYDERDKRVKAMGYDLKPRYCPACIAESLLVDAQQAMVRLTEPVFGVTLEQLLNHYNEYKKYIDLIIGLVLALEREEKQNRKAA